MAATLAEGKTTLTNVAKEPEISDLADFLNSMGAKISGAGTDEIRIKGVKELKGTTFKIPADRIEAGTYLVAAALTNGKITVKKIYGIFAQKWCIPFRGTHRSGVPQIPHGARPFSHGPLNAKYKKTVIKRTP